MTVTPDIQRLLPQDGDAERCLLGSIMRDPVYALDLCELHGLGGHWMHVPAHATIYGAMWAMNQDRKPIDISTVTIYLREGGRLVECGGPAFIMELGTLLPTAANCGYYLDILRKKFRLRSLVQVGTEIARRGYDETDDETLLDEAERLVLSIRQESEVSETGEMTPQEGVMAAIHVIETIYYNRGKITGLSTGFPSLDKMTDGMRGGDMWVIAARPSMGKTALAMNIAEHVAVESGKPVVVFSAEMSTTQLYQRILCSRGRLNVARIHDGTMTEHDFASITTVASKVAQSKLLVRDAVGMSIQTLKTKARRLHKQHGIAAIFVDYLQCLRSGSKQANGNREREISEISGGCKQIARELGIPIVVLAQINRSNEKRESKRPRLSDLRESGSIEQDADLVGLLHRDEYYADTTKEKEETEGRADLIIAKSRNGPTGEVALTFLKEFTRFEQRAFDTEEVKPAKRNYHQ